MVSGQELFLEREKIKNSLSASLKRAYDNGIQYAEKTRSYRILLRQTMLQLEADGAKATTLKDIAKGADDVAQAEFEMMVATSIISLFEYEYRILILIKHFRLFAIVIQIKRV